MEEVVYAMYKGDNLLHVGTVKEIAAERGVLVKTIQYWRTPTYQKRVAKRKNARNYIEIIEIRENED